MGLKYRLLKSPDGKYVAQQRILISFTERYGHRRESQYEGLTRYDYSWEPFIDLGDCDSQMVATERMKEAIRNLNGCTSVANFDEDGNEV